MEERFRQATSLIANYDEQTAQSLILNDYQIDEQEVEIEEDCLKILALHQPVAGDLRFIITVIKVNNELERIADMGVNIAIGARAISKSKSRDLVKNIDFSEMSEKVLQMLKNSLDALIARDASLARKVFLMDDEVDAQHDYIFEAIKLGSWKVPSSSADCSIPFSWPETSSEPATEPQILLKKPFTLLKAWLPDQILSGA